MPLSHAAKAALCLCPPAAMVGTVATVPAAKRAVHHLTAPHHPPHAGRRVAHRAVGGAAAPTKTAAADQPGCDQVVAGAPATPLVTYAAPIPDETVAGGDASGGGSGGGGGGVLAPVGVYPIGGGGVGIVTATPTPTPTPGGGGNTAVPEPASWALLILGTGAVGATLRRRRRAAVRPAGVAGGFTIWNAGTLAEAGDVTTTAVAKHSLSAAAHKAMLCACPAAIVAGSVVAVPPVRHAVHAATAPAAVRVAAVPVVVTCSQPPVVPVSASGVGSYPDTVTTAPRPS